jgi:hypothetical protein
MSSSCSRGLRSAPAARYRCQSSGTPFSVCSPASSNVRPDRPCHEVLHRARDQHFAGARQGSHPRRDVNRDSPHPIADELDLARVAPRTDLGADLTDRRSDGLRVADGSLGSVEDGEETVARRVDLAAPEQISCPKFPSSATSVTSWTVAARPGSVLRSFCACAFCGSRMPIGSRRSPFVHGSETEMTALDGTNSPLQGTLLIERREDAAMRFRPYRRIGIQIVAILAAAATTCAGASPPACHSSSPPVGEALQRRPG